MIEPTLEQIERIKTAGRLMGYHAYSSFLFEGDKEPMSYLFLQQHQ